jgi:uncharacterized protein YkwD
MNGRIAITLFASILWITLSYWWFSKANRAEGAFEDFKLNMLAEINRAREAHGLRRVELDEHASKVAQMHVEEMARNSYFSHWDRNGLKPYMRYSLAGGYDAVSENLTHTKNIPLHMLPQTIINSYLAERPPNDGHKRTLLLPYATHVGIGIAVNDGWVYVAQEFVTKIVKLFPIPRFATLDEKVQLMGKVPSGWELHNIDVFYEPLPSPMTTEELSRTSAYGLPEERKSLFKLLPPNARYSDGSRGDIIVADDGAFICPIPFFKKLPGVYTIVVWLLNRSDKTYVPATNASIFVCRDEDEMKRLQQRFMHYLSILK